MRLVHSNFLSTEGVGTILLECTLPTEKRKVLSLSKLP